MVDGFGSLNGYRSMEYTKGLSSLPTTMRLQQQDNVTKCPKIVTCPSPWTRPSRCTSVISRVIPSLVVALLLFSMGMIMYNASSNSFPQLPMMVGSSSESNHWKPAHSEAVSNTAAELRLHRRLRGIAHYLNISPVAAARGVVFQVAAAEDAVSPNQDVELLPKDAMPNQEVPSRELSQTEQMVGDVKWPKFGSFQQMAMHQVPNGADPIHNR